MVNVALLRIGANVVSASDDGSPNALRALAVWEYVRNEVLQAKDWRFAKIRYKMVVSATAPLYAYQYAYPLPADFLRLVKPRASSSRGLNPVTSNQYWSSLINIAGESRKVDYDPPVYPDGLPYIIEALPDGTLCLMSDYDNTNDDLHINYIRKVTSESLYTPAFKNCLIYRLAQELAVAVTENIHKAKEMERLYKDSLISAEAVNESLDYLADETGSMSWENAGR
jgi:hypothetical protein